MKHDISIDERNGCFYDFFSSGKKIAVYQQTPFLDIKKHKHIDQVSHAKINKLLIKYDMFILQPSSENYSISELLPKLTPNGKIMFFMC